MSDGLVAVVLAAGAGTRLRPLTELRPKPLCPVDNVALLDRALTAVRRHTPDVAVNVHAGRDQMTSHLAATAPDVLAAVEEPVARGTAGALGALRDWIAGRDVLVHNADAYLPAGVGELLEGWDGRRCRLLVAATTGAGDFGSYRYVGACLLPWQAVRGLAAEPSGLYERLWSGAADLDLVVTSATAIDCGTPSRYLRANLHASGGRSVVGPGAVVQGDLVRSVVWPDARVGPGEVLVESIRAGAVTVAAPQAQPRNAARSTGHISASRGCSG